jgi:hypothetical protein
MELGSLPLDLSIDTAIEHNTEIRYRTEHPRPATANSLPTSSFILCNFFPLTFFRSVMNKS